MNSECSSLPLAELAALMADAQVRLEQASNALRAKHLGGEWEEYRSAYAATLHLERAIAAVKGEEYAETLDFPVQWCPGAPLPHLMVDGHKALLAFLVNVPDPNWDGTYVTIKSPKAALNERFALVEFKRCMSAKFGTPNDEVFSGHPLNEKGMEPYKAQVVHNSRWIAELERINSVHRQYRPERWKTLNHYVFWFHDDTFECVAESYTVERFDESFADMLARMCQRLLG